jgi:hypothetical protein
MREGGSKKETKNMNMVDILSYTRMNIEFLSWLYPP